MQKHGFKKASVLLKKNIQKASESRGFAQSRVLTHWSEIVGEEIASISVPTKVSYKTDGFRGDTNSSNFWIERTYS